MLQSGEITSNPVNINKIFCKYYSNLYTSKWPRLQQQSPSQLDSLEYSLLDKFLAEELGHSVTAAEIQDAIKSMQNGKVSGVVHLYVQILYSTMLAPILAVSGFRNGDRGLEKHEFLR